MESDIIGFRPITPYPYAMKILIADDHELFREGLRKTLKCLADNSAFFEAADFHQVLSLLQDNTDMDLALLDLHMPAMDPFEALERCFEIAPTLPIIILSASEDHSDMKQALNMGVMGYIPKSEPGQVILSAIQLVLSGGVYVPPKLITLKSMNDRSSTSDASSKLKLTPRQFEVLNLISKGYANKEIARLLELSNATVKAHVSAIFKALNVNSRTQAIHEAKRLEMGE